MIRALQIVAVLLLICILSGVHYGAEAVFNWTGPQFATGFGVGVAFVCVWFLFLKLCGLKLD
jgi:hypothetical protein